MAGKRQFVNAPRSVRLLVAGRVQGVGYRWFARREAVALGLTGTVANLPDGRVEVHAAGPSDALEVFTERLRQGPPASRVSGIEEAVFDHLPTWQGFEIVG